MKGKRFLSLALVGVMGLSMMTIPVKAAAGGDGNDVGENSSDNVVVNYNSLLKENTPTNKVGPNEVVISTDVGYAWDDISFTYVKTVDKDTTLTTDDGYQETITPVSGQWYIGTYATLAELESDENAKALPPLTMDQIAQKIVMEQPVYSSADLAKTPKIILHNYSDNNVKFNFAISNSEYNNYNSNGMLMLLDEEGKDVDAFSNTFTQSGNYMVSEDITLNAGSTNKYGVAPSILPNSTFETFSTNLIINFTSAN